MFLNVSSFTTPLGHSCANHSTIMSRPTKHSHVTRSYQLTTVFTYFIETNGYIAISYRQKVLTDTFESSVEDLQLFPVEVGLLHKTVDPLWSVTHRRQFTVICYTSCAEGQRCDTMSPWHAAQVLEMKSMCSRIKRSVHMRGMRVMTVCVVCVLTLALIDWGAGARATAGQQFEEALLYGLFTGFDWRITWKQPITQKRLVVHRVAQIVDAMPCQTWAKLHSNTLNHLSRQLGVRKLVCCPGFDPDPSDQSISLGGLVRQHMTGGGWDTQDKQSLQCLTLFSFTGYIDFFQWGGPAEQQTHLSSFCWAERSTQTHKSCVAIKQPYKHKS